MNVPTYMPILKGKQGEFWALRDRGFREGERPILEIPRIPWDFKEERPAKSLEGHVESFVRGLGGALRSAQGCGVDGGFLDGDGADSGAIALDTVLSWALDHDTIVIPSTGLNRDDSYNRVASQQARRAGSGVIVRLEREDVFGHVAVKDSVEALLDHLELPPEEVDLVVDLKFLREEDEASDLQLLVDTFSSLPLMDRWRSLWFAGGSFPEFLTNVERNSEEFIPRLEWTLWTALVRSLRSVRTPRYADYGVAHPISPDVDRAVMNMSANIRYTTEHAWLVIKGEGTRGRGNGQFHELCRKLVVRDEYSGRSFSDGDAYFFNCSVEVEGPGNGSKWRQAGTSHHLAFVSNQVEEEKGLLT